MNIFDLRRSLISDYSSFIKGYLNIKNKRINELVEREMDDGLLWPDPLIQISPFFEKGKSIDDFIDERILHPKCRDIFRIRSSDDDPGFPIRLHSHQSEAIEKAYKNQNYVLTTGTGSGKSLSYIVPIVNHVLKTGTGKGIKAIIVYPMNALANSQENELKKFLQPGSENEKLVTFKRYTGQESAEDRKKIWENPPDIILTNYVMLELILTRPEEAKLVENCQNLKYLVLDELHTYRGRQGADVAMLVRRTRLATGAHDLICVGTSATMAAQGDLISQKKEVARVAALLFGSDLPPENVIGESLLRVTKEYDFNIPENLQKLKTSISQVKNIDHITQEELKRNPLASWIESTFGLSSDEPTKKLIRATPISISGQDGGAKKLQELTGQELSLCQEAIMQMLLLGYNTKNEETNFPIFAFRLHQFISRGDTVYAGLDDESRRYLTLQKQIFIPGSNKERILLPLCFCRQCGQEFYTVFKNFDEKSHTIVFSSRDFGQTGGEDDDAGYLYELENNFNVEQNFPPDWRDIDGKIPRNRRDYLPTPYKLNQKGEQDSSGKHYFFFSGKFRYCPSCGVAHSTSQQRDFGKLSVLGTEGRSTATTVLSLSVIKHLKDMEIDDEAKKLLSFTDNRQDASLQSGHFNDFIQVSNLRGALYRALDKAGDEGITHDKLTQSVFDALALEYDEYARDPDADRGHARQNTDSALREILGYMLYYDLRRGWRVTAPNLEQTGLLAIDYLTLDELSKDQELWDECHPALKEASDENRYEILKTLLDFMRRSLAIDTLYLSFKDLEQIIIRSRSNLIPPWGFEEGTQATKLIYAAFLYPRSSRKNEKKEKNVYLSIHSAFGQYLKSPLRFGEEYKKTLDTFEVTTIITDLLQQLERYGIVISSGKDKHDPAYQLRDQAIIWRKGDGEKGFYDPLRQPTKSSDDQPINSFFRDFYRQMSQTMAMEAREHTAQVNYEIREEREEAFRKATLPILYCSPTMELGIDISQLNVVNMRNIPPTPANYAQRSGRAGRSGQPALIFSYSSSMSPHDQYFFKRPSAMVSGSVASPQIDLANEDMLTSHINAIWLSLSKMSLGNSLQKVIDLESGDTTLPIRESLSLALKDEDLKARSKAKARYMLESIEDQLTESLWYKPDEWLDEVFSKLERNFNEACDRWRDLYKAAFKQQEAQNIRRQDRSLTQKERRQADRLRREAESQMDILTGSAEFYSDFYSYRYFASEGFLPGYNFPRLPLSAFIPAKDNRKEHDEYLSRPRFLAITEFGPNTFVYHEGSRYIINKVILPASDDDELLGLSKAKLCENCGYLNKENYDICQHCKSSDLTMLANLFRLQNVVAFRRSRINCDEEERIRMGFEMRSTVEFNQKGESLLSTRIDLKDDEEELFTLNYGDSATIWRINMGYRSRKQTDLDGFLIDVQRGTWLKESHEKAKAEEDDEIFEYDGPDKRSQRVVPFVSDTKNCLLLQPMTELSDSVFASLQSALKVAIQRLFELEDRELAAEALPSRDQRRSILFYEAAEGGAGVLKQLLIEDNYRQLIRTALEVCHFDPDTFEDLRRSEFSKEDCEAACYDCLLSYANQLDHEILDRQAVKDTLIKMLDCDYIRSSTTDTRRDHYHKLKKECESELEEKWLMRIYKEDYILPTHAQEKLEAAGTTPDFTYSANHALIYIDGPHHEAEDIKAQDRRIERRAKDLGFSVIRFTHKDEDWQATLDRYPQIFGKPTPF
ncbi:MAG: DEAD/DEAH box helicase [Candidatus Cloacimonadaceae bacterium]